jgi:3-dehydroquinate dehydratase-1
MNSIAAIRIGRVKIGDPPRLVAVVTSPQLPAQFATARAAGADLAELRLDYVAHLPEPKIVEIARKAAESSPLPLIATLRLPREGGARRDGVVADEKLRESAFLAVLPHVQAVDVELSSPILPIVSAAARKAGVAVIVSYHHFQSTPSLSRLRALAQLAKAKGGEIVKIVTTASTPVDIERLIALLQDRPGFPVSAFAMGRQALLSRVVAYYFHSCLLYGSLPAARGSVPPAPGIPTLAELTGALNQMHLR